MIRYIKYFNYLIRHKWFVYRAGVLLDVSNRRLLLHDISKLKPRELFAYAECFYAEDGSGQYKPSINFDIAWNYHQKDNPHHWQYWVLIMDSGDIKPMPMPAEYIKEMVADWAGAGRAINGKWEVQEWYNNNKHKMILHETTKESIEIYLRRFDEWKVRSQARDIGI